MAKNESHGFNIEKLHAAKAKMNESKDIKLDIKKRTRRNLIDRKSVV
mgnify:CR=1 FL=1